MGRNRTNSGASPKIIYYRFRVKVLFRMVYLSYDNLRNAVIWRFYIRFLSQMPVLRLTVNKSGLNKTLSTKTRYGYFFFYILLIKARKRRKHRVSRTIGHKLPIEYKTYSCMCYNVISFFFFQKTQIFV